MAKTSPPLPPPSCPTSAAGGSQGHRVRVSLSPPAEPRALVSPRRKAKSPKNHKNKLVIWVQPPPWRFFARFAARAFGAPRARREGSGTAWRNGVSTGNPKF